MALCYPFVQVEAPARHCQHGMAGQNSRPKEIPQILPIFLPFPKMDAVESAASEEMDNIIEAKELQIERKHFYVELRENERGRFLRITEEAHGRRNSIIVPSTGVDEFTATIAEVLTNNEGAPA
ncbi:MAG TPA: hypothetical protein VFA61_09565 [Candidatus Udaeobacter sp.]|nr:hypothetical protein [Candidatus Udaeobacter sp.]